MILCVYVDKDKSAVVLTMKRSEKKRFGKGFIPSHEFPNEQTKESYMLEIGELTKRLERYEVQFCFGKHGVQYYFTSICYINRKEFSIGTVQYFVYY